MRHRELDYYSVVPCAFYQDYTRSSGAFCRRDTYSGQRVDGSWQSMTDAGTKETDEIRTRYLEHQKSSIQSFHIDFRFEVNSGLCGANTDFRGHGWLDPGYAVRGNPWILDPFEINQCISEAFRYFESGCADQETLLANFAWELPDVKRLWPAFRDLFVAKNGKHRLGNLKDVKREAKVHSSAYLGYNFGLAPLIGDLVRIYDNLRFLQDHIDWLRENHNGKARVEFRKSLKNHTADQTKLPSRPAWSDDGYYRVLTEQRSGFKAWALITYDVSALTDLQLKTKTLMRAFGLNNPAAVLWEAIPYSFVVDWVSNVGSMLSRLEVPIKLPCVFHDCGYGVWTESIFEDWYVANGYRNLLRRTKTRGYGRRPGLPINISALSLETPTAKQLSLGLALLAQKW